MSGEHDPLYVAARRVLLDGLAGLGIHRGAVILVGAQAVYLRVGEGDLSIAPYTTDADLAIDPMKLAEVPPLEEALRNAGFEAKTSSSVGIWERRTALADASVVVAVDLLLPIAASANPDSRAASLEGHGKRTVRNVRGLDGALVDRDPVLVTAMERDDARSFEVMVAGVAALLIAKLWKIDDRVGSARSSDKDAIDVLRLLRGTSTEELAARYRTTLEDPRSRDAAETARELLKKHFVQRGEGLAMIERGIGPLADVAELTESAVLLGEDLLAALA